eukprot:CAMPEP_0182589978 /NCGR_PEP_ID=MMETSP1324-20130603/70667_1 /TAXON_ID=236786 /ORGANISM="Florenciella sp., Strain RCC1587" /LENGTH=81 /DNA_ID=CAMNT_0024807163 /DNA_START=15 /DNA_END=260 /DNA_ORIENTATION=+
MSGSAVIIWAAGGASDCLYFRSPMERERFRFPLTRPAWLTKPPTASMRVNSRSSMGLWSSDNANAEPFRHMTARESPAFAT